jgi:succinoglycan biosynthesis transport protein ExoP
MNDTLVEAADEPSMSLKDYLAAISRRRKAITSTMAVCLIGTLLLVILLPPYWESGGTILIEQQEVPQDLVRTTISSYADQRIQVISQRVMTTQNLLDVIRRYDLYPEMRKRESRETLLARMREDISFRMISADVVDPRSGVPRQATIAFRVAYKSRSPEQAVKVANELTTLYLNENVTDRARLAQDASGFLSDEGDRLSKVIADLEAKLAAFKSRHVDGLPDLTAVNLQLLDRTEQELRDEQTRLMSLDQQRVYLEAQLAQLKPNSMLMGDDGQRIMSSADRLKALRTQLASAQALYAPTHPDIARLKREIAGLETSEGVQPATNDLLRDLETARGELGQARQRYAPNHPDVQRLERRVASLEAAIAAEPATALTAEANVAAGKTAAPPAHAPPDNPAYIQIQAQLSSSNNDKAALEEKIKILRARAADYQHKITVSPEVEQEYRGLTRDYENAQLKYREVRSKQMEAQFAQNLEADRKGERFTLIEPPLPPEKPVSPNRLVILILGILLTFGASAGIAALLEKLDETIRGRRDVARLLDAPPLVLVPRIVTDREIRTGRRRVQLATGATAAACVALVIATHLLYRPLDVLWFEAMRRFGM